MDFFIQQILNRLSIASVITLMAVGVTLIFGLTGIINFAHGEFLMVDSIVTWLGVQNGLGYPGAAGQRRGSRSTADCTRSARPR